MLCFWINMNNILKIGTTLLLSVIMSYSNCLYRSSICFDLCLLLLQYNGNVIFMHEYVNVSFSHVCTVGQWGIYEKVIRWPLMYLVKDFKQCFSSGGLFVNQQAKNFISQSVQANHKQSSEPSFGTTCSVVIESQLWESLKLPAEFFCISCFKLTYFLFSTASWAIS